jgi:hypothetical protein
VPGNNRHRCRPEPLIEPEDSQRHRQTAQQHLEARPDQLERNGRQMPAEEEISIHQGHGCGVVNPGGSPIRGATPERIATKDKFIKRKAYGLNDLDCVTLKMHQACHN